MHASIWTFQGDPDELVASYEAMFADVPVDQMIAHLCLRTDEGMIIVDTCPSREVFEGWSAGPFPELRRRYGLPEPSHVEDHPVYAAITEGHRL
jgi:hypothetical protein